MGVVARLCRHQVAAAAADRGVRIVVNLAACDVRRPLVQQRGQHADQARLGLPAQSQQNEIVARKHGVDHLRHHGIFVSDDAGKQLLAALNLADQIVAEFVFDAAVGKFGFGKGTGAKRAEGTGQFLRGSGQAIPPLSRL